MPLVEEAALVTEISPFEAYRREWHRLGQDLFFETMREHPEVFRNRFPLIYDDSEFAEQQFWILDRNTLEGPTPAPSSDGG